MQLLRSRPKANQAVLRRSCARPESAARVIRSTTSFGCDTIAAWLERTVRTVAPILWLSKTPSELKTRKSRLHADNSLLEKLIEVSVQQRCNGVLNRKAWSAEKNPVSARDEIALVHKTNGSYRRRGPTNSKRRGVGIDDGVLRPEESLRCARVLASPRLSIPEHLWPAPDEFGSPGSRQNNFAESGATIFHSTR
jgi:hypothetical protein